MDEILIDGSTEEGGGQIIRTAVGLSALTGKPTKIINIRKNRPSPGLKAQHLKGIEAVSRICNATVSGLKIGSETVSFRPGKLFHSDLRTDIGTAGSVTLVLQSLIIPAVKTENVITFEISGGTHVQFSPSTDYFQHIFCGYMKRMGLDIRTETVRHGFYPKGGGLVKATLTPVKQLRPITLLGRGKPLGTHIWSIASENLKQSRVAERQAKGARDVIPDISRENITYENTLSPGTSVHIHSHFENCELAGSALGRPGMPAETVGRTAAAELKQFLASGCTADSHMSDQILPFMAMAKGQSAVIAPEFTGHAKTNIWVIKKFLDVDFRTTPVGGGVKIECSGA